VFLMQNHSGEQFVNVDTGTDLTILELAQLVADVVGFTGAIVTDPSKPDGAPRKLLDVSRLETMGWKARIGLREGVAGAYTWYLANAATARG